MRRRFIVWFCVILIACFPGGAALRSLADGGRLPCSGKTIKDCGQEVSADVGCTPLVEGCDGEVISKPFAGVLTDGTPVNNMVNDGMFFQVCVYRFECIPGLLSGCRRGPYIEASYVPRLKSGPSCQVVEAKPEAATP